MKTKYIIIGILLFIPAFYLGYYVYEEYFEDSPFLVLKADKSPIRIRPEKGDDFTDNGYNPIYDNIKASKHNVKSSKLAKAPEQPIKIASKHDKSDPISRIIVNESEETKQISAGLRVISETEAHKQQTQNNIAAQKKYYVQVSTLRSVDAAHKDFDRIYKNNSKVLNNLGHKVLRYKVKDKGVYFKLLIGPVKGPEHARLICKKLIQAKQTCIVKRI